MSNSNQATNNIYTWHRTIYNAYEPQNTVLMIAIEDEQGDCYRAI